MNYQTTWDRIKTASLKIDHARKEKQSEQVELPERGTPKWNSGDFKWEPDPNGQFLMYPSGVVEVLAPSEGEAQEQFQRRGFLSRCLGSIAKNMHKLFKAIKWIQ